MDLTWLFALLLFAIVLVLVYFFFGSFLLGAGYQPTPPEVAERMMVMGAIGRGDRVFDLGAGTGALVFRAAQRGARVKGFEAEPLRYLFLRLRCRLGVSRAGIEISRANFFEADLSSATVILAFLWPGAMGRLAPKLERELKPGTRVVSYWHPIPGWEPAQVDGPRRVYLYIR